MKPRRRSISGKMDFRAHTTVVYCSSDRSKMAFFSRSVARKKAKLFGRKYGKKFRIYQCTKCNAFHLTTKGAPQ